MAGAWDGQRLQGKSFPGLGEFGLFARCIGKPLRFLKPWVITVGFCYESGCCQRLDLQEEVARVHGRRWARGLCCGQVRDVEARDVDGGEKGWKHRGCCRHLVKHRPPCSRYGFVLPAPGIQNSTAEAWG